MKKGFSMGEMLIAMIIIGVIAAMSIPAITNTKSKSLKPLFKAAYSNIETIVGELINDVSKYPSGEFPDGTLCANFFEKINTVGGYDCSGSTIPNDPNARTTNAMRWYGFDANFSDCPTMDAGLSAGDCIKVSIDVDGAGKGINSNDHTKTDIDILDVYIYDTGKMTVIPDDPEDVYLTQ